MCLYECLCAALRKKKEKKPAQRQKLKGWKGLWEDAEVLPSRGERRYYGGGRKHVHRGSLHDMSHNNNGEDGESAMTDPRQKRLQELTKRPGNNICAECGKLGPEWASYNIGVFICATCASFHRSLGSHISKVKSLNMDNWDSDQVSVMEEVGNSKAKAKYEAFIPVCYRRPCSTDPDVLKEQWIRAKYEREEFIYVDRQVYTSGRMEDFLWKRGKEDGRFQQRKFVLSELDGTLKYYVKESHKEPKATIQVFELNATFCPKKIGNPNGVQLTYVKDGSTRNIFIYSETGKTIVDWFMAIRCVKLNQLRIAYPGTSEIELAQHLTRDFLKEGWMFKTGPRASDAYKHRWFTLDDRKLMYLEDPLDPYPKGEVFLGYHADGFAVKKGVPPGMKEQGFGLTLRTRDRIYLMGVQKDEDRAEWIKALQSVIERPLTPQDNTMAANLVRKRSTFSSPLHLLKKIVIDRTDQIEPPVENEEFLMVTKIGDGIGESKSTQTEQKVQEICMDLATTSHEVLVAKHSIKTLTAVLDKVWTTFVAFNVVLLPCIMGMSLHHLNSWMGDAFGNHLATLSSVLLCWLFTGLPLYVFFLIDMDSMVSDLVNGKVTQQESATCQTTDTTEEQVD